MITSKNNTKVKQVRKLQKSAKLRDQENVFVVEGTKMVFEAPVGLLKECFISESFYKKNQKRIKGLECSVEVVSDQVFEMLSDTKTPQGILGLVKQLEYSLEEILKKRNPLLLILESIQDPGNVGTIFRTAEATGVTGIVMNHSCVDIYNPKTTRSTMGAVYRQPFVVVSDFVESLDRIRESGVKLIATDLTATKNYDKENYREAVGLLIGNEGNGLSDFILKMVEDKVKIPMEGQGESLNVAIAASVLAYEAYRQRGFDEREIS